jgi:hypothetical protein
MIGTTNSDEAIQRLINIVVNFGFHNYRKQQSLTAIYGQCVDSAAVRTTGTSTRFTDGSIWTWW